MWAHKILRAVLVLEVHRSTEMLSFTDSTVGEPHDGTMWLLP